MKELSEKEMLHRAAAYCSAAERCRQDVEKKVAAAGLPPEAAERIITHLVDERFIDEARFCRAFVNDKLRFNQWGRIKIAHELRQRGIPSTLADEALQAIDEESYREQLTTLLKEKLRTVKGKDSYDTLAKLYRFAGGRGYESGAISACLKGLLNDTDHDDLDME